MGNRPVGRLTMDRKKTRASKKGVSGNPSGRPKGSLNLSTRIVQELNRTITVMKNGKPFKMKKRDVIATNVTDGAVTRDYKCTLMVMRVDADEEERVKGALANHVVDFTMPDKESLKLIAKRLARFTDAA
jgi:Family of unknown function (DUF5681)